MSELMSPSMFAIVSDNETYRVFSLPDKSTILDTKEVTVSSFKSLTNNSNSRNESNDSAAPPMTSLISITIR